MAGFEQQKRPTIDAKTLYRVTREVIARLEHGVDHAGSTNHSTAQPQQRTGEPGEQVASNPKSNTGRSASVLSDQVITSKSIADLPVTTAELFVNTGSVITPSARDDARARGITINRLSKTDTAQKAPGRPTQILDFANPNRAATVAQQLSQRNIHPNAKKIILSDTPASDLYHQCVRHGEVAAMVGSLEEVSRFADELEVTAWVLDMKRLNLIAAVNVVASISRTGASQR